MRNRRKRFLFILVIVLGVGALVAVQTIKARQHPRETSIKSTSAANATDRCSQFPNTPLPPSSGTKRPNIVFVLTDDLAWNLVQYMPHVLKMQQDGVTFANYFVTNSLCCPSRSTIFTGRYPHNTGVYKNSGEDGGYPVFRDRGEERVTFATSASANGYRTAMLGKYLNRYRPYADPPSIGWTRWGVAGWGYPEFNYRMNIDGRVARYGAEPKDYLTDVLSGLAVEFITQTPDQPFLIETATFAPHEPYTPAPRDAESFPGLQAPRSKAFNIAPDANDPEWLRKITPLNEEDMTAIDADFRKRVQSVQAVDRMIGELQAAAEAIGQANNTYFIFSSDNGLHMGERRLRPGKMTPYDIDTHVPLIVTGPSIPAGRTVAQLTANVDLCPTLIELTGGAPLPCIDGHSLVPLMHGREVDDWRTATLIEHHGPSKEPRDPDAPGRLSGNPPSYEALRTTGALYVEYVSGEREYHNLADDPEEVRNTFPSLSSEAKASWHAAIETLRQCQGAESCWAAEHVEIHPAPK